MWPGCNTHHDTPDYIIPFNNSMEMKEKMQAAIDWLDLPYDKRPQMISVYIQQVDQEGHRGGPDSPKVKTFIYFGALVTQQYLDEWVYPRGG